jgi:hypothetical protein
MPTDVEMTGDLEFGGHPHAESLALAKAVDQTWLRTRHHSFVDVVQEYKAVEAEFLAHARARDDEKWALEVKRRIAEALVREAHGTQDFDTCQRYWNDLLRLGFTNTEIECVMIWYCADSCRITKRPDVGLSVLEPLIAEYEQALADPKSVEEGSDEYYQIELESLGRLRAKLKAQQGKL